MSDLSRLLDDLYATAETDAGTRPAPDTPRAPAWSSTEALDEAFGSWVPGSPLDGGEPDVHDGAEAAAVFADDTWLADTEPAAAPLAPPRWRPADDDILPGRGARRRRR